MCSSRFTLYILIDLSQVNGQMHFGGEKTKYGKVKSIANNHTQMKISALWIAIGETVWSR